jgi:hypothetical protein
MSEPGTDNGFPSLYPALDDLYATFDPKRRVRESEVESS